MGGGTRRVLLLHGVMSLAATWWRVGPALERHDVHAVALDLPWHGAAPRPPGPPEVPAFADDVAARLDGPVDAVVGHSLGALVALALVARHDTGARRLVLEEPSAPPEADRAVLAAGIRAAAAAVATDRERILRLQREANPRWDAHDVQHSVEGIARADADVLADAIADGMARDLVELVRRCAIPVHVVAARRVCASFAADGGSALHEPARAAVRALVRPSRFVELDGGHFLHRDDPDGWVATVVRALDD